MERLQKILSAYGIASRRAAEDLLRAGRVTVNGAKAALGDSADPQTDRICVDGMPLPERPQRIYIMLHKPRGYVTTLSDELGRKTAAQLVDCGFRVYPVGRLDYQSEGLLLFTNDGAAANRLMHPKGGIGKVYEVTVQGALDSAQELLSRPVMLDGYQIRPPKLRLLRRGEKKATFEITIYEGRNRQIRRMCEMADLQVLRLCRIKEGNLCLGSLPVGKWRYLSEEEIRQLEGEGL